MFTYNIPVPKLGIEVPVTVPSEEQRDNHAQHGVRQRVNDALAGHKRSDFKSDEEFHEVGLAIIQKPIAKIEAGLVGVRVARAPETKTEKRAKRLASAVEAVSDEEFEALLAEFVARRARAA